MFFVRIVLFDERNTVKFRNTLVNKLAWDDLEYFFGLVNAAHELLCPHTALKKRLQT